MNASKYTLIAQAVGMYVMHSPLYAILIVLRLPIGEAAQNGWCKGLLIASLVLTILLFPFCIANIVAASFSFLHGDFDPRGTTMRVKLALIPWYLLNFVIGFAFVGVLANPFLMVVIPIALALLIGTTCFYMLATSFPDVMFLLKRFVREKKPATATEIVSIVFLFIFCLDIIGSVIAYRLKKREEAAPTDSAE